MKKCWGFAIMGIVLCGCSSQGDQEIYVLQTQVAELSASNAGLSESYMELSESYVELSEVDSEVKDSGSLNIIPALSDEEEFILQLSSVLTEKGWIVEDISANTFVLTTPNEGIFIIEYIYESSQVSRLMIYSLWMGVGTSNLEYAVLSEVNNANDQQYLAKVSVDSDGDFWMETTIPFTDQLDVDFFCDYVEWFEENQTYVLLNYFTDYIQ